EKTDQRSGIDFHIALEWLLVGLADILSWKRCWLELLLPVDSRRQESMGDDLGRQLVFAIGVDCLECPG
ncbi:MAG TPA: hypothetical protein VIX19_16455, partial [Terriglobales bacterium]